MDLIAPFEATVKQKRMAAHYRDPGTGVVVAKGAIRSGKTQAAARLMFESAIEQPTTWLAARQTYRELEDSLKPMLLRGDGSLPPLIPPEAIAEYRASDDLVVLRNGARIVFRSLDDPAKLLGLTLGGIFLDQAEEIDGGPVGENTWDTLLGRLNDPAGPRKALVAMNPAPLTSWQFRRLANPRTADPGVRIVHFRMRDNAAHLPADYLDRMEATKESRPHWFRTFVLGEDGAFEGAAFEEWSEGTHVVDPFRIPAEWHRFQSLDHGMANPTAVLAWAVDHDENAVIFDAYYSPGLVSAHAAAIKQRCERGTLLRSGISNPWLVDRGELKCYADPSVFASQGLANKWGAPASVATEYSEHGISLYRANNDREAGYARLLELLHVEPRRVPPPWSRLPQDADGAPRLYAFSHLRELVDQFASAPVSAEGTDAGRAYDSKWANQHGHALDACRYGAMTRPSPSPVPPPVEVDPRRAWIDECREQIEKQTYRPRRHYL
jgi:PBSX family phage terminase large subunit